MVHYWDLTGKGVPTLQTQIIAVADFHYFLQLKGPKNKKKKIKAFEADLSHTAVNIKWVVKYLLGSLGFIYENFFKIPHIFV